MYIAVVKNFIEPSCAKGPLSLRNSIIILGLKRVAWPPPPEDQDFDYVEQAPVQAKVI